MTKTWLIVMACGLILILIDAVPRISKAVRERNNSDPALEKYRFGVKFNSAECEAPHDQAAAAIVTKRAEQVAVRRRKAAASRARERCPHCQKPLATGACVNGKCPSLVKVEPGIRRVR